MARDGCIVLQRVGQGTAGGPPGHDGADSGAGDSGADSVDNISIITRVICPSLDRHDAASSKHDTDTESLLHGCHRLSIYLFSKTLFKYPKSKPYKLNAAAQCASAGSHNNLSIG